MQPLLEVSHLETTFSTPDGKVNAVNDVSFQLFPGESLGIVGESGSGKTQVFMSIMGLLADNGKSTGSVLFKGEEILGLPKEKLNKVRGSDMSLIFQDPMTSLNPFLKVSKQLTEVLVEHTGVSMQEARARCIEMLSKVGIPEPTKRFDMYPHEFSGGMRQRVMIAMALLCQPDLLIADEPTTALDVTIQAQILKLMAELKREMNTAIIMITHDLGVVAGLCDRVLVMYGGRIVESGTVREIFYNPKHPYTMGLLASMPRLDGAGHSSLQAIPGQPPNLQNLPQGCSFHPRCPYAQDRCKLDHPPLRNVGENRLSACILETHP
ncbi:ATP-binding cassette domain-containing protein [Hahella aquimaris]|uniref:ABC transporter ATP-binding protein n=1 Tax=Hahella sp. HNIBRBA332 TaxID=3015983 RepID=UPI00273CA4C2|nr:oligopeptide/dipeptide ABC transporter ATP-binding protein [Hahella sp. HNIBRBA332]WLQ12518.1 ATP-binding cassette domain-containing protein [Hahella sp. HNIBRBA332]